MIEWIEKHAHPVAAFAAIMAGAMLWLARFVLTRHREFVAFTAHMDREERDIWPSLTRQIAENHDEAMELLRDHGERISAMEARMPNGEITAIKEMVQALYERRTKPRGGE